MVNFWPLLCPKMTFWHNVKLNTICIATICIEGELRRKEQKWINGVISWQLFNNVHHYKWVNVVLSWQLFNNVHFYAHIIFIHAYYIYTCIIYLYTLLNNLSHHWTICILLNTICIAIFWKIWKTQFKIPS